MQYWIEKSTDSPSRSKVQIYESIEKSSHYLYDDKIVNLKWKKTLNDTESFAVDDWDNPEKYLDSAVVQHQDWEIQR